MGTSSGTRVAAWPMMRPTGSRPASGPDVGVRLQRRLRASRLALGPAFRRRQFGHDQRPPLVVARRDVARVGRCAVRAAQAGTVVSGAPGSPVGSGGSLARRPDRMGSTQWVVGSASMSNARTKQAERHGEQCAERRRGPRPRRSARAG